jgi:hypothetical protein
MPACCFSVMIGRREHLLARSISSTLSIVCLRARQSPDAEAVESRDCLRCEQPNGERPAVDLSRDDPHLDSLTSVPDTPVEVGSLHPNSLARLHCGLLRLRFSLPALMLGSAVMLSRRCGSSLSRFFLTLRASVRALSSKQPSPSPRLLRRTDCAETHILLAAAHPTRPADPSSATIPLCFHDSPHGIVLAFSLLRWQSATRRRSSTRSANGQP